MLKPTTASQARATLSQLCDSLMVSSATFNRIGRLASIVAKAEGVSRAAVLARYGW